MSCETTGIPEDRYNMKRVCFDGRTAICVVLNHRAACLSWSDAFRKGVTKSDALLFHVDRHPDFSLGRRILLDDNDSIADDQEKELEDFVKNKLSVLNYEFIVLSMYRGLIGDAISIHWEQEYDQLYGDYKKMIYGTTNRTEFLDRRGRLHTFYLAGSSIRELTGYQGLLTDRRTHQDVQGVFKENSKKGNLILDVDLDFFTYVDSEGVTWALNERNLDSMLESDAFRYLLGNAKMMTIALEPFFCGSTTECRYILKAVSTAIRKRLSIDIEKTVIQEFNKELSEEN
jgi:hypothetical protein